MARSTPRPLVKSSTACSKSSFAVTTTRSAPYSSARFSFPGVPTVPITRAPALTASWVVNRPTPPPMALISHRLAGLETVEGVEHVIAGQRLDRQRGTDIKGISVGQRHQNVGRRNRLFRIAAALFDEGGDAVADLQAAHVGPSFETVPEISKPSTSGYVKGADRCRCGFAYPPNCSRRRRHQPALRPGRDRFGQVGHDELLGPPGE